LLFDAFITTAEIAATTIVNFFTCYLDRVPVLYYSIARSNTIPHLCRCAQRSSQYQ
jgi:hypothetical protein